VLITLRWVLHYLRNHLSSVALTRMIFEKNILQSDFHAKNTLTRKSSLNLDLNLNSKPPINGQGNLPNLRSPSIRPIGPPCTRCLSYKHGRPMCSNSVRCTSYFRLGHVALSCRFQPRFPRLLRSGSLPSFPIIDDPCNSSTWFSTQQSLTSGPSGSKPLIFPSFGHLAQALLGLEPRNPSSSIA
jgi:hypothetical protein